VESVSRSKKINVTDNDFGMNMDDMFISMEEIYKGEQNFTVDPEISVELEDIYDEDNPRAGTETESQNQSMSQSEDSDYSNHLSIDIGEYASGYRDDDDLDNTYTRGEI
jgi:hypothetical protein